MFCSIEMNKKINHVHEMPLRLVFNDYTTPFEELLKNDKSISIHHRNIHNVAIEMYKVKNKLSPPCMQDIFDQMGYGRKTRMGDKFTRYKVNKVYKGQHSLRIFGPIIWNTMLPVKIKDCSNLAEFKNSILSWIPKNCPCRLCKHYVHGVGFIEDHFPRSNIP